MPTKFQTEIPELLKLAKAQVNDCAAAVSAALAGGDAELNQLLHIAATAVVDSLEEGSILERNTSFRKNFLVIAKAYNKEVRTLLHQALEHEVIGWKTQQALLQSNQCIDEKIAFTLGVLQHSDEPGHEQISKTSTNHKRNTQ